MRVPLSWIREFAPVPGDPAGIAERLNEIGLVVDGLEQPGREVGGVVVARVLEVLAHPDADKLTLVDVDFGTGQTRVVCGARNLAAGDLVPYAPAGATLPGGLRLERRRIRGQVSDGMLCSARELGIGDDHEGILHLAPDAPLGADVRDVLGLDDAVFELDITPNRPDAMSVAGVARDLAAAMGVPFTLPEPDARPSGPAVGDQVTLGVEAPEHCPRYVATAGAVEMGPSPEWMARRLTLAGMRPISSVVDVTNYVLLERGQPLHAFDLDRLAGPGIVVRTADDGERLTTLDGVERVLCAHDLLICDADRVPQAIAGIMGGAGSEVSAGTTRILLESAFFTPETILRTSKRLGLRTESSARFERGVDPNGVEVAARRAWELLALVAAGAAGAGALDSHPEPFERPRIRVRTARVNAVLGTSLGRDEIAAFLGPLGIEVAPAGDDLDTSVPTFRPDLEREVDLVEEVARLYGYNRIARTLPSSPDRLGALTPRQRDRRLVADVLVGAGLCEAMSLSLVSAADLEAAGLPGVGIEVENPIRAEESLLRPAILPGLLRAVAFNASHGLADVALFETGHVFLPPRPGDLLPDEREHVAVVLASQVRRTPHEADRSVDVHDAVGRLEAVLGALELGHWFLDPARRPGFHPGRCAVLFVDGHEAGVVGEVAPEVVRALDLPAPVVAFELDLDRVLEGRRRPRRYEPPSRYPPSNLDLAFVVPAEVPAARVRETLEGAGGGVLEDVRLFDVFRSDALGPGRVSLAFRLRFRAPDRTLGDDDVARLRRDCIDAVVRAHGAVLRG